eukprot:8056153-Pyramimonas_sp.AAC.1
MSGCVISSNKCCGTGAGVYAVDGNVVLTDTLVKDNGVVQLEAPVWHEGVTYELHKALRVFFPYGFDEAEVETGPPAIKDYNKGLAGSRLYGNGGGICI